MEKDGQETAHVRCPATLPGLTVQARAPPDSGSLSPQGLCTRCSLFLNYTPPGCLKGLPSDTSSDQPVTHVCPPVPFVESIPHGICVGL